MHPILGDRRRLVPYLLLWQLLALVPVAAVPADIPRLLMASLSLPVGAFFGFVCLSPWYICRAFPLGSDLRPSRIVGVHLVAGAFGALLLVLVARGWALWLDWLWPGTAIAPLVVDDSLLLVVVGALLFWLSTACHYLLMAFEASREAETRSMTLDLLAREAELRALRAQIDPHFIFNSLHSISALTTTNPAAARRMCLLLADFLRETLRLGSSQRISLAEELALVDRFLAIEQVRLGTRLHVVRDTDPEAAVCLVPPLLLQPIVENAVVHGIGHLIDGGTVQLAATRDGSILRITLENPCDPDRPPTRGVGLGLELLRQRIRTQCGTTDAVHAVEADGRFRVDLRLPAVVPA